jgi:NAD(P)-dependent dehydrogenase (short-subunit alcohol dehydrogenase family)
MRLQDKVVIVTGASSGIGQGIAELFAEEGAKVICAARREKEGNAVVEAIRKKGGNAIFIPCDVSVEAEADALAQQTLDAFGRIDVLVNNAGVNFVKAFEQVTSDDWDHVIGVDLRGTFLCIKACIGQFLEQGSGNVVNIATVHTQACVPGAVPYDAAKWGMIGLTKSLAVEYAARGIRFNALSPGLIDTQIWKDIRDGAEDMESCLAHWWSNIPMGRVGTIREIAFAAAFLASDEASYITGSNLLADGGMTSQLIGAANYASKPQQRQ